MSKSRGNIVDPWDVLDTHGADAFRWYYFTSKQPWDGYRFSVDTVGESVRQFMLQLWNTYGFYVAVRERRTTSSREPRPSSDRRSTAGRSRASTRRRRRSSSGWRTTTRPPPAARSPQFVDDLSNWYVRRSRRRFWDGDPGAFWTLRECLRDGGEAARAADAVHRRRDLRQPRRLGAVRAPVRLPRAAASATRSSSGRCRWRATPSSWAARRARTGSSRCASRSREAVIVAGDSASGRRSSASAELVREELNVKELRFVDEAEELGRWELKPNYRSLGPRFGKRMPQVAEAVAALDAARVAETLREGGTVGLCRRRRGAPARRRRPADGAPAARGLPGRARRHARGGAQPRARRRAAPRGPGARGGARRADGAQERGPERRGPDRAAARRRRRAARGRARARGLRVRPRRSRRRSRLDGRRRRGGHDRGPRAA